MASIERRTTAVGEIRWDVRYRAPDRRHRTKTFRRKLDAQRFAHSVETDITRGEWLDPSLGRELFTEWADRWLSTTTHLKPKTRESYESILRRHLVPAFGQLPVGRIDHPSVLKHLSRLQASGARPGTIRNVRDVLRMVLRLAQRSGAIKVNPAQEVKVPTSRKKEMLFLNANQVMTLADAISRPGDTDHNHYGLLIRMAAFTGLRAGEISALRVDRLDLMRRRVHVVASASEAHGKFAIGPPKTYQRRTVPLPSALAEDLVEHVAGLDQADFVFKAPEGGPHRHSNFYRRHFRPAVARAGLPEGFRFHDLRHTYAAMLIEQNAHPRAIMERLGHSTISVTLGTYGHLLPSLEESLTEALDDVYRAASQLEAGSLHEFRATDSGG